MEIATLRKYTECGETQAASQRKVGYKKKLSRGGKS